MVADDVVDEETVRKSSNKRKKGGWGHLWGTATVIALAFLPSNTHCQCWYTLRATPPAAWCLRFVAKVVDSVSPKKPPPHEGANASSISTTEDRKGLGIYMCFFMGIHVHGSQKCAVDPRRSTTVTAGSTRYMVAKSNRRKRVFRTAIKNAVCAFWYTKN